MIKYRFMKPGEEQIVCELVNSVFSKFVSPLYPVEGTKEFQKTTDPKTLKQDCAKNRHIVYLAFINETLVGALKTNRVNHISWFFVDGKHQKEGIGRGLLKYAISHITGESPKIKELTVNSSPNSYGAYKKIGFSATGSETEMNGIRYTPFKLLIDGFS